MACQSATILCADCGATNHVSRQPLLRSLCCGACRGPLESLPWKGTLAIALRSTGLGTSEPVLAPRVRAAAGIWGLLLGPWVMLAGAGVCTLATSALLSRLGLRDTGLAPNVLLAVAYAGGLYGGLVSLGAVRNLVRRPPLARLVLATLVGIVELVTMWVVVYELESVPLGMS